ncbi:hypothetical protein [Kamptonema formosum]|nr:hypothetical protein [Oscillatoria sp. PCC 10802]
MPATSDWGEISSRQPRNCSLRPQFLKSGVGWVVGERERCRYDPNPAE